MVNTIFLSRESDTIPPILGSDTAGRMEVDGDPSPPVRPLVLCLYTYEF